MKRVPRIKLRLRRFSRRHPWIMSSVRSFTVFSAAFGGAYGFIAGSRSEQSGYDPNTFAIGASFLFAVACVALATLSMRLRFMRKRLRKIALQAHELDILLTDEKMLGRDVQLTGVAKALRALLKDEPVIAEDLEKADIRKLRKARLDLSTRHWIHAEET